MKHVDIELHTEAKPYHKKTYPSPCANESVFKKEAEGIFQLGVPKGENRSEWGAPNLIQPKK